VRRALGAAVERLAVDLYDAWNGGGVDPGGETCYGGNVLGFINPKRPGCLLFFWEGTIKKYRIYNDYWRSTP
jgi:hypothetical protein